MKVIWSDKALLRKEAIEDYIFEYFGLEAFVRYQAAVNKWVDSLQVSPYIGVMEPLLDCSKREYRSFVVAGLSKGIYCVENDVIMIVDWWDTRRGIPTLLGEQI